MKCVCFCHSPFGAANKGPCEVCLAFHVVPETETTNEIVHGNYQLEPKHFEHLQHQLTATAQLLTDQTLFGLVLRVGHVQYGASILVAHGWQMDYLEIRDRLCKKMSAHFNQNGWPTAVVAVIASSPQEAGEWSGPALGTTKQDLVGGRQVVSDLQRLLPALTVEVMCPHRESRVVAAVNGEQGTTEISMPCTYRMKLERLIQHVNDRHRWTRAQIADWLESLDIDLEFPADPPGAAAPG